MFTGLSIGNRHCFEARTMPLFIGLRPQLKTWPCLVVIVYCAVRCVVLLLRKRITTANNPQKHVVPSLLQYIYMYFSYAFGINALPFASSYLFFSFLYIILFILFQLKIKRIVHVKANQWYSHESLLNKRVRHKIYYSLLIIIGKYWILKFASIY